MHKPLLLLFLTLSVALAPRPGITSDPAPTHCPPEGKLIVGVFPRRNPALTDSMFTPMTRMLGELLGCPTELRTASDFPHFWRGVESGQYDLVHYNQFHYISSADKYQVIAHNEERGKGHISGAIYTRRDSGLNRIEELAGKTIIFGGGPDAMMSHIIPRYLLINAGVLPASHQSVFAPNPPNAVLAAYYGQVDAAGAGDVVMHLPVVTKSIDTSELQIIASSAPISHLPWAVKQTLPEDLKQHIQQSLLALNESEPGRVALQSAAMTGIDTSEDSDYDACRRIIEQVREHVTLE